MPDLIDSPRTKSVAADLVGCVRRFGANGVPYMVLGIVDSREVQIRVLTTGEETSYPIADVLVDPED